jgi:hypothetical protein
MKQFDTGAVIEDGQGGACFFREDYDPKAFWMPALDEVLQVPCRVYDALSSQNGSAYLAVGAKWPIVCVTEGRFEHLPLKAGGRTLPASPICSAPRPRPANTSRVIRRRPSCAGCGSPICSTAGGQLNQ